MRYIQSIVIICRSISYAIVPFASVLILNLAFSYLSQGEEIARSARETIGSPLRLAIFVLSTIFGATACWLTVGLTMVAKMEHPSVGAPKAPVLASDLLVPGAILPYVAAICALLPVSRIMQWPTTPARLVSYLLIGTLLFVPGLMFDKAGVRPNWPLKLLAAVLKNRSSVVLTTGLSIIGFIFAAMMIASPVNASRIFGSWSIVYMAFGIWPLLITLLFVILPTSLGFPSLTLVPVAIAVIFSSRNNNHLVRTLSTDSQHSTQEVGDVESPAQTYGDFSRHVKRWMEAHCGRGTDSTSAPCPVIFVAAEGGGLRAAYWTNAVLAQYDRQSGGHFYDHVFALSGVSGGSLGIATYVGGKLASNSKPTPENPESRFLREDYLSPILGGLLFGDFVQAFLPKPISNLDRAFAFEKAFEDSWGQDVKSPLFGQGFKKTWESLPSRDKEPSLYFNAANVETGKRYIVSSLNLPLNMRGDEYFAFDRGRLGSIDDLRWSTAVSLSARFPIVGPPGLIISRPTNEAITTWPVNESSAPPQEVMWGRLVDGGYYENSGAATLLDVVRAFNDSVSYMHVGPDPNEPSHKDLWLGSYIKPEIVILVISNDPQPLVFSSQGKSIGPPAPPARPAEPPDPALSIYASQAAGKRVFRETNIWTRSPSLSEIASPVSALLNSRDARATSDKATLAQLIKQIQYDSAVSCANDIYKAPQQLAEDGRQLEWTMKEHKQAVLLEQLGYINNKEHKRKECTPLQVYEEVSLASISKNNRIERNTDSANRSFEELVQSLRGPGLGWSLSQASFDSMDELATKSVVKPYESGVGFQREIWGSTVLLSLDRYYKEGLSSPKNDN